MADHYDVLTTAEKCYWNAYTRLRELSDWAGFTDGQADAKADARAWLVNQRKEIWRCAEGKKPESCKPGWDINNRRARYEQLKDDSLNSGSPRNLCQLPTGAGTDTEKAKISEREMWWNQASVDDTTKRWRTNNANWLTNRRKQVWHLINDPGGSTENNRAKRYDNLCVATKTGEPYDDWAASHNTTTGAEKSSGGSSSRAQAVSNCRKHLGTSESPPDSNRGDPQPSGWQRRVYGDDGVPWCACFATCMAWDAGVEGGSSAGVSQIVSMAKAGQGMFRGYTTDPSKVLRGDLGIVSCTTCHVGMVVDSNNPWHQIEGNTSPGAEGSQFNGGTVAEKTRGKGEIIGWALVDYP